MPTYIKWFYCICCLSLLTGCTTGKPNNVEPITHFDVNRYLGQWYEIARLDHSFERGLDQVTATYSLNPDKSIKVINRGFNITDQQWQQAQGKAKFVEQPNIGHLKVSFFGPFYGSYIIFALEKDYSAALVSSYNYDYLWILARDKTLDPKVLNKYLTLAQQAGFDTNKLIYPQQ
ncbi:lipocalin [Photobacterium aquimaris]|uniref:Outer membrane lipoprotein Blc n=1 Tax=Photobacterium aquimaris TaxID=512643 RepID=A0A2T3IST9_9GAMM|nr:MULTISPECIES: lipocalin family protein [Photobacterium]OBU18554.1 lipocalin [Photobacterium aquimaris]OBU20975.1 lipocalin [Photobacterium aquimaris]PSU31421.1 lipocalin [Photobacterium aquimaris]PSW03105.1 lipocalin [Photobacterium aquimaris]